MQFTLSFEEAYHGMSKDISYKRMVPAEGVEGKTCTTCQGRGVVTQQARTPFGVMQTQAHCPTCHGAGQEFFKDGRKLEGGGLDEKTENLTVTVPA